MVQLEFWFDADEISLRARCARKMQSPLLPLQVINARIKAKLKDRLPSNLPNSDEPNVQLARRGCHAEKDGYVDFLGPAFDIA